MIKGDKGIETSGQHSISDSSAFNLTATERQSLVSTSAKVCFRGGLFAVGLVIIGILGFDWLYKASVIAYGFTVLAGVYFLVELIVKKMSYGYIQKGWLWVLGGICLYPILWFILGFIFFMQGNWAH